ncbi:hypothetical protein [Bartonella choladocola]|uniref:Uncharacterized protein n=1 Tax=Bartonella choladocola TaxID=2750995 RepID=A0A1U9MJB0_9HYPH|nr:hypothetical protein [Bartonella choladocola]AQT47994.1 hypothetical protein BBC0122_018990 [Bartonella choladocola]
MNDPSYARMKIGGHLLDIKQIDGLIATFKDYILLENDDRLASMETTLKRLILQAIENDDHLIISQHRLDGGYFLVIENFIRQSQSLGCSTYHEAGDDYNAGFRTILPGGREEEADAYDGQPIITPDWLESQLNAHKTPKNTIANVKKLLHQCAVQSGETLPKLTAKPELIAALRKAINNPDLHQYVIHKEVRSLERYKVEAATPEAALHMYNNDEAIFEYAETMDIIGTTIFDVENNYEDATP